MAARFVVEKPSERRVSALSKKLGGPHRARPALSPEHPVHVVLRTMRHVPSLRERRVYEAIHRVVALFLGDTTFRIVHVSMQKNHLHLLVEADDSDALAAGMRRFTINAARALNRVFGSSGKVFAYRYHATQLTTPRQARNALAYVLNNWRRHREDYGNGRKYTERIDGYSSAATDEVTDERVEVPRLDRRVRGSWPDVAVLIVRASDDYLEGPRSCAVDGRCFGPA